MKAQKTPKQQKIKQIAILVLLSTLLIGCGNISDDSKAVEIELTNQSREISIDNKDLYTAEILKLITTGQPVSNLASCTFSEDDIVADALIEQIYWFNGSIYAQVNNKYMFRFQLDSQNHIESYIKYELEA